MLLQKTDYRPTLVCLALSLVLHALLVGFDPDLPFLQAPELPDVVVVELYEPPSPSIVVTPPPEPEPVRPEPVPAKPPPPPPEPPEPMKPPEPAPVAEISPAPVVEPPAPAPPAQPAVIAAPEPVLDPTPPTVEEPEVPKTPSREDFLAAATEAAKTVRKLPTPDPAGNSREVTLSLDAADARYRSFLDRVRASIDLRWKWREALLSANRPGSAVVRFTMTRNGDTMAAELMESSGSPLLDEEALAAVQRADLPPFPDHWTLERINFVAQFDYRFYDER